MKNKVASLKSNITNLTAGIFTIQESNYNKRGCLKLDNWDIFEAIRNKKGGGTILGAHRGLKPILIQTYSEEYELIVIEISVGTKVIRVMTGYGPQETWLPEQRMPFFMSLEEEIAKAELSGRSIMICFDANSKMGPKHIPGDPHPMSENGNVLDEMFERHAITVANGLVAKATGVLTRKRITKDGIEESAIDLVCLSQDLVGDLVTIVVDEEKNHCLESIIPTKKGAKVTKSDHNSIISKFKFEWNTKVNEEKVEYFNLKNKDAQQKFKQITSETGILTSIVNKDQSVTKITKKLLKRIEGCKHQSFKKFKFKEDRENNTILKLFDRRRVIKNKDDEESKKELKQIEDELANRCAEENYKMIMDEIKDIECDEGGFNMGKLWKLKKKLCPYKSNPPTSMKDPCGNIITGAESLKKHTMNHYESVLKNREMDPSLESMRKEKEELCNKRIELAKLNKSEPWKMYELEVVLKYLKKEKSKDPDGNINELFNSNVAGKDMKEAMLTLMNKIKDELVIPTELTSCNISSIYKNGVQSTFDNYRGVFRVTILRTILD